MMRAYALRHFLSLFFAIIYAPDAAMMPPDAAATYVADDIR